MLNKREKTTIQRFDNAERAVCLARRFFEKGFTSLTALVPIALHYYPDINPNEINNFWHFRKLSTDMLNKMDNVLEQLKGE